MSPRHLVLLGVSVVVALGGACAGGGNEGDGGSEAAAATTTSTTNPPTSILTTTTTEARDPVHQEFCLAAGNQLSAAQAIGQRLAGPVEGVEAAVDELRAQNREVGAAAPEVIRAEVNLVVEAGLRYLDVLEQAGFDTAKVPAGTLESLQTPQVRAAANREADYLEEECGLNIDGSPR